MPHPSRHPEPSPDDAPQEQERLPLNWNWRHWLAVGLLVLFLIPVAAILSGNLDLSAQDLWRRFMDSDPARTPVALQSLPAESTTAFTFAEHDLHPDRLYPAYFGLSLEGAGRPVPSLRHLPAFQNLLDLYVTRQAQDDNFTIRVVDARADSLLELAVLSEERERYHETGSANWGAIDRKRRNVTRALVKKYRQRGIPRAAIQVKWGRANQVLEARQRDAPYIEYEVRLAEYLGLSLLATEIGTVETFNQDRLVSAVGARSRYQMMPYILRQRGIHHYELPTAYGNEVNVYEEWHPLLTMEPAFTLLRGYVNAVGHEIPGISAYHTGPGNIFKVFRMYLTEETASSPGAPSVVDAYVWALTDGFEEVSDRTSFGSYSRGYVPAGYGSLKATADLPIDTTETFRGERVQVAPGARVYLSDLLRTMAESDVRLDWNSPDTLSLYARFQEMNPHFVLPDADDTEVPARGDVLLTSEVDNIPVRFFLPLGAMHVVNGAGETLLDEAATFRFDHDTYRTRGANARTVWDLQYDDLLESIQHFGFTEENRERLRALHTRFARMAEESPNHYRKVQLDAISTHLRLWQFEGWDQLAQATSAAQGRNRLTVRPPSLLETTLSPTAVSPAQ